MMSAAELWYRAKKVFALYLGVSKPINGGFLADHYGRRRRERSLARALLDALRGAAFPMWIPARAAKVQRRFGLDNAWRQRAIRIARQRFADPSDIALFRIEHADQLHGYIRRFEDAGLNKIVNPRAWRSNCMLADKVRFYRLCAEFGLAHPHVVAITVGGRSQFHRDPGDEPLLLKPARGEGGRRVRFLDPLTNEASACWRGAVAECAEPGWCSSE